jgi:predicted SprT family Zn-dependent metalloprotease
MKHHHRIACAILLFWVTSATAPAAEKSPKQTVGSPPKAAGYDTFYKKHVDVGGFSVLSSAKVADVALLEAAWVIDRMLEKRPDIRKALIASKTRFVIMGVKEFTTQMPEHSDLTPSKYWDRRARGLGATPQRPAVSCGEENLLRYTGDPYITESIIVHEFAHAIHHMGLAHIDKEFDRRLKRIYDSAMAKGLWKGKYASNNRAEYWAEGVQSYFDTNRKPDHDHNHVDTREELAEYDPDLAKLIDEVFRGSKWRYTRPEKRRNLAHLKNYNATKAPTFGWPAGLQKWYDAYQAKKKAKAKTR